MGSRLTGWNAVKSRVEQLQLELSDDEMRQIFGLGGAERHVDPAWAPAWDGPRS